MQNYNESQSFKSCTWSLLWIKVELNFFLVNSNCQLHENPKMFILLLYWMWRIVCLSGTQWSKWNSKISIISFRLFHKEQTKQSETINFSLTIFKKFEIDLDFARSSNSKFGVFWMGFCPPFRKNLPDLPGPKKNLAILVRFHAALLLAQFCAATSILIHSQFNLNSLDSLPDFWRGGLSGPKPENPWICKISLDSFFGPFYLRAWLLSQGITVFGYFCYWMSRFRDLNV